jgi:hypothetical protein
MNNTERIFRASVRRYFEPLVWVARMLKRLAGLAP